MGLTDLIREKIFSSMIHGEFPFNKFGFPNIYDEDDVREKQEILFQRLLKRLDEVGILRKFYGITRYKHLSLDDLVDIPTIGKKELSQFPVTRPSLNLPPFNKTIEVHTSGTTGKELYVKWNLFDIISKGVYIYATFMNLGIEPGSLVVNSSLSGYASQIGTEKGLKSLGYNVELVPITLITEPERFVLRLIKIKEAYGKISALMAYPTVIEIIVNYLIERSKVQILNDLGIKVMIAGGAGFYYGFNKVSKLLGDYGIKVIDIYSAVETGISTFICSKGKKHLVPFTFAMISSGNKRKPYGRGGFLLTTLHLVGGGTEFMNYDIGDVVTLEPSDCEVKMPVITGITRKDNLVKFLSAEDILNAVTSSPYYPKKFSLPVLVKIKGREIIVNVHTDHKLNKNEIRAYSSELRQRIIGTHKTVEDLISSGAYDIKVVFQKITNLKLISKGFKVVYS